MTIQKKCVHSEKSKKKYKELSHVAEKKGRKFHAHVQYNLIKTNKTPTYYYLIHKRKRKTNKKSKHQNNSHTKRTSSKMH